MLEEEGKDLTEWFKEMERIAEAYKEFSKGSKVVELLTMNIELLNRSIANEDEIIGLLKEIAEVGLRTDFRQINLLPFLPVTRPAELNISNEALETARMMEQQLLGEVHDEVRKGTLPIAELEDWLPKFVDMTIAEYDDLPMPTKQRILSKFRQYIKEYCRYE